MSVRAAFLLCAATAIANAQAIVRGTVTTEQGQRVMGVEVSVASLKKTVRTDSTGEYRLVIPEGHYWLTARALGFISIGDSIEAENNVELIDNLVLRSLATILDTVTTTEKRREYNSPGLRAFEERRAMHFGRFIAEAELRKSDNRQFSDVLRRVPGLNVVKDARSSAYFAMAIRMQASANKGAILGAQGRGGAPACPITIYMDGVLMFDQGTMGPRAADKPPDLNALVQTRELAGVEYYAGGAAAPTEYRDRSGCGLLMLWTRER